MSSRLSFSIFDISRFNKCLSGYILLTNSNTRLVWFWRTCSWLVWRVCSCFELGSHRHTCSLVRNFAMHSKRSATVNIFNFEVKRTWTKHQKKNICNIFYSCISPLRDWKKPYDPYTSDLTEHPSRYRSIIHTHLSTFFQ